MRSLITHSIDFHASSSADYEKGFPMDKHIQIVIVGLLVSLLASCSAVAPFVNQGESKKVYVKITRTPIVLVATKIPKTRVIPTIMPTPTNLPGWCYQDPTPYLDESARIVTEIGNVVRTWNSSPRGQGELLAAESSVRSLIRQAEALEPPEDFESAHEHFLNAMQGTLHALFGITDNSDANRIGNDAARNKQFELAGQAIEQALAERDTVCWQE